MKGRKVTKMYEYNKLNHEHAIERLPNKDKTF